MKKFTASLIAALALAVSSQAEVVVANWNQNSNSLLGGLFGYTADPNDFPQASDIGSGLLTVGGGITSEAAVNLNGQLVYTWIESFSGSTVNVLPGDVSGGSIAIEGGTGMANNGSYIQFMLPLTGFKDLIISYATRGTSSGFTTQTWSWSTDGTNFTSFATVTGITTTFALKTLPVLTALDNVGIGYVRVTFTGATTTTGNNRLDNIRFSANLVEDPLIPVPALEGEVVTGGNFQVVCPSSSGYSYQLYTSTDLSLWIPSGSSQVGNGSPIVFDVPEPASPANKVFYKVNVKAIPAPPPPPPAP